MGAAPSNGTAVARVDVGTKPVLSLERQKKFVEAAMSTNLDRLPDHQKQELLIAVGRHLGLRPELGEVMVYQGRIYITIAGMRRSAHKNGLLVGRRPRPATRIERRDAGYEDRDIVWLCEIYRRGSPHAFTGWGKVTRAEIDTALARAEKDGKRPAPVGVHPVEIARKRAEYDGLRAAFPIDEELSEAGLRFIAEAEEAIAPTGDRLARTDTPYDEIPPALRDEDDAFPIGESAETTDAAEDEEERVRREDARFQ